MQVTDLKAILDYEHNEQWLAALNCYKGIWDHNPTDDVAIRYCFFCWYLIWQWEQIDFPGEDNSFKCKSDSDQISIQKFFPTCGLMDEYFRWLLL